MSDREIRFVSEYIASLNATDAARRAGYKVPNVASAKLMKKPHIIRAIADKTAPLIRNLEIKAEYLIGMLDYALRFNPARWFRPSPNGKWECDDPSTLPDEVGRMIKSMRIKRVSVEDGPEMVFYEVTLQPHGTELLEMAMNHKGMFPKEVQNHLHQHLHVDYDELTGAPPTLADPVQKRLETNGQA